MLNQFQSTRNDSEATSAFRGGNGTAQFACGKHALRALSQSIAKEFGKQGIHSVHVRLDAVLDTPGSQKKMPEMYAAHKTWGSKSCFFFSLDVCFLEQVGIISLKHI